VAKGKGQEDWRESGSQVHWEGRGGKDKRLPGHLEYNPTTESTKFFV
jgi:hypothetical protein